MAALGDIFEEAVSLMEKAQTQPRGDHRQKLYYESTKLFEDALRLIESSALFSNNETLEDVATQNLRYLLVPAYLGKIATSVEMTSNRIDTLSKAESHLINFLQLAANYGIDSEKIDQVLNKDSIETASSETSFETAARSRDEKIARFREMQQLDAKLEELEKRIKSGETVDDEVCREYYISKIKKLTADSIEILEREVRPALFLERNRPSHSHEDSAITSSSSQPMLRKTFTIQKNDLRKKVFGIGYPSAPSLTVGQFITQKINDGELAFQTQKDVYNNSLQRYAENPNLRRQQDEESDEEREKKEELEDPEELARKRRWDEFKDETPRGSGNRYNMG